MEPERPAPGYRELMKKTGISESRAYARLALYRQGLIDWDDMMTPSNRNLANRSPELASMKVGPRRSLTSIPGETPLERQWRGR